MKAGTIRAEFEAQLLTVVKSKVDAAGRELERKILDLIWERTSQGIDIHGRQWRRYKAKNYDKIKRAYGRSKDDWLVLTGNLKSGLRIKYKGYEQKGTTFTLIFEVVIPADLQKQVKGLLNTTGYDRNKNPYPKSSYEFIGLAESGPTVASEQRTITAIIKKKLELD